MNKDIKRRSIASKQLFAYKLLKYLFISEKTLSLPIHHMLIMLNKYHIRPTLLNDFIANLILTNKIVRYLFIK